MIWIGNKCFKFNYGCDTRDSEENGDELLLTPTLIFNRKEKDGIKAKVIGIEWLWFFIYISWFNVN